MQQPVFSFHYDLRIKFKLLHLVAMSLTSKSPARSIGRFLTEEQEVEMIQCSNVPRVIRVSTVERPIVYISVRELERGNIPFLPITCTVTCHPLPQIKVTRVPSSHLSSPLPRLSCPYIPSDITVGSDNFNKKT